MCDGDRHRLHRASLAERAYSRLDRGASAEHVIDDERQPAAYVANHRVGFHRLAV
jgi:hypothetical protein